MIKILITMGDPAGIGPEIIAKTLSRYIPSSTRIFLVGAISPFVKLADRFCWAKKFLERLDRGEIDFVSAAEELEYPVGVVNDVCGKASFMSLLRAIELIKNGHGEALVTAPVSKKAITLCGEKFSGHTEMLAQSFDSKVTMLLFDQIIRVGLVSTHVPLSEVVSYIDEKRILGHIIRINHGLVSFFGVKEPIIGVLGLNPHAGEAGEFGKEEETIKKALDAASNIGIRVVGPLVPDTAFLAVQRRRFDAYLAMYHDQGLIPLKTLGFYQGVNLTLGLPFVRTSPDHGTAMDIAGKGIANPLSFINALRYAAFFAKKLIERRNYEK